MNTAEWKAVPAAIRQRSFFSATVEDARFLQEARNFLDDYLRQTTVKLPDGTLAMKAGGRGEFVTHMKEFMQKTGMERSKDETLTDIGGSARLRLIFDTQVRMAHDFGNYKQGLNPEMMHQFPAWRFIRGEPSEVPRPLHEQNEGEVRLKTDEAFWLAMNHDDIGGFGLPHGPWGFNSGMDVEDVARDEAIALGLLDDDETPAPQADPDFNDGMTASTEGLDEDLKAGLSERLGEDARMLDDEPAAKPESDAPVEPLAAPEPRLTAPLPVAATPLDQVEEALAAVERQPDTATELAREIVKENGDGKEQPSDPLAALTLAWALAWLSGDRPRPVAGPDEYGEDDDGEDGLPA